MKKKLLSPSQNKFIFLHILHIPIQNKKKSRIVLIYQISMQPFFTLSTQNIIIFYFHKLRYSDYFKNKLIVK